jgi:hypothetical protein
MPDSHSVRTLRIAYRLQPTSGSEAFHDNKYVISRSLVFATGPCRKRDRLASVVHHRVRSAQKAIRILSVESCVSRRRRSNSKFIGVSEIRYPIALVFRGSCHDHYSRHPKYSGPLRRVNRGRRNRARLVEKFEPRHNDWLTGRLRQSADSRTQAPSVDKQSLYGVVREATRAGIIPASHCVAGRRRQTILKENRVIFRYSG